MLCHPQSPQASRPFLRWPGGKARLLPKLLPLLPLRSRLVEPFVGAGAVFLSADYDRYLINDANPDLVAVWAAVKQRPRAFIEASSAFFCVQNHTPQAYYRIRDEFNGLNDRFERAIRLPYLNKFCFNGVYRVNRAGMFNVPYGTRSTVPAFPWDEMAAAAVKLERCTVSCGGFEAAIRGSGFSDVVYCDPPYLESSTGDSFTAYTEDGFTMDDHRRLVVLARHAAERGATVIISNHDTVVTRDLYRGFELHSVDVRRSVGGKGASRATAKELIAVLRPKVR